MTCVQAKRMMDESFLAGGCHLPPEVEDHLGTCPECRAYYAQLQALGDTLAPLAGIALTPEEEAQLWAAVEGAAGADVSQEFSSGKTRLFSFTRVLVTVAAVFVLMVIFLKSDIPESPAFVFDVDDLQLTRVEIDDIAPLFVDGDSDLLPSLVDDESAGYLIQRIEPGQADDILEGITAEEIQWLTENF